MPITVEAQGKQFTFPDGTNQDQIGQAIDDYFTSQSRQPEQATGELPGIFQSPELNELSGRAFKAGLGGLLTSDPQSISGIIQQQYPESEFTDYGSVRLPSGEYQIAPVPTTARLVAEAGPYMIGSPIGGTAGKRLATEAVRGLGTEAVMQGAEQAVGGSKFSAGEVLEAGALGAAGQGVGEILSGTLRGIFGKMSDEAKQLIESGQRADVPVLTSDALPPRTFMGKSWQAFTERVPFAGTAGKRQLQESAREGAIEKLAAEFGIDPDIHFTDDILKSLDNVKAEKWSEAVNLKRAASKALSSVGDIQRSNFNKAIDEAIQQEMSYGSKADSALVQSLQDWKNTPGGDFSFLDGLRSRLGDEISDFYSGKNSAIGSKGVHYLQKMKNALTDDMLSVVNQADTPLLQQAAKDWRKANALFSEEYGKYQLTALKTLIDKGDVKPELIDNVLRSKNKSQIGLLFNNLDEPGRNAAKGHILQMAIEASKESPERFLSELGKMDKSIKQFFQGEDLKILKGYQELLKSTQRAARAGVQTQTGQELYGVLAAGAGYSAATLDPTVIVGLGLTGSFGRIYETPFMRDALLKIANTNPGTIAYDRAVRGASQAFTAYLQSERSD